jgi:hypothetical protein
VGFVVEKVALGQVFSEYFGFPCQFSFHRLLHIHHHSSPIIRGGYNRPISGRRAKWTQSHPTPRKKKNCVTQQDRGHAESLEKLSSVPLNSSSLDHCVSSTLSRRENEACCWSSPAQSFSGLSPGALVAIFYCLRFETALIRSVRQLNCCWSSPAQSFLASVSSRSMAKIYVLS